MMTFSGWLRTVGVSAVVLAVPDAVLVGGCERASAHEARAALGALLQLNFKISVFASLRAELLRGGEVRDPSQRHKLGDGEHLEALPAGLLLDLGQAVADVLLGELRQLHHVPVLPRLLILTSETAE